MSSDFQKIAEHSLRNLFLQMVDYYTESINKEADVSNNLLNYFNRVPLGTKSELNKDEAQIKNFINDQITDLFLADENIQQFQTNQSTIEWLTSRYSFFGIPTPPDGFLQIDDGPGWWREKRKLKNGFFAFVEVFNYNPQTGKASIGSNEFTISKDNLVLNTSLSKYLENQTKKAYIRYAKDNAFNVIIDESRIKDDYLFGLDRDKNSFHYEPATNGLDAKLYIRYYFNEFGQKLEASIVEVQGVTKLDTVPGGIRKNYIVSNFFSGIDGYEKYYKKPENKTDKSEKITEELKKVKKLIDITVKSGQIAANSRIAFVFSEDYEFLSFLDGENKNLNNNELYVFLRDNKELNKTISSLNAINCEFGGPDAVTTESSDVGAPAADYSHFTTGNSPFNNPSPKDKAAAYRSEREKLKFDGDAALKSAFEAGKKSPAGAAIADLYESFLNKVDYIGLASMFATTLADKVPVPDLRKLYFKLFVQSLDVTELIDCVVLNAGKPLEVTSVVPTPPKFDATGKPIPPTKTFVTQSSLDFERDLKNLIYGRFAFFYNIAAAAEPEKFDFTNDGNPGLPTAAAQQSAISEAAAKLEAARTIIADNFIFDDAPDAPTDEEEAALEEAYLEALAGLDDFLNKNFMYILMVPESQVQELFASITTNDPQYEYKPQLVNAGIVKARNTPGFTPETFISTLFKNIIYEYTTETRSDYFPLIYDNIAKKNKKLKDSAEIEKEIKQGKSAVGNVAKMSKNTLPPTLSFNWYDYTKPTFDINGFIADQISNAMDEASKAIVSSIIKACLSGMDLMSSGNPDKFNNLDPSLKAEYCSNDPVDNILNGSSSGYASPREIYLKAIEEVFPNNNVSQIECMFGKLFSEISIQVQSMFLRDAYGPGDTNVFIVREIFSSCGLDDSYFKVREFFSWLNRTLAETGGLNELLQRIQDAEDAAFLSTDICEAPFVQEIAEQLAANESREALAALEQILSLLSPEVRKNMAPNLYNCSNDPNKKAEFEDYYPDSLKKNFNTQLNETFKGINDVFNNDISKFKPIILKLTAKNKDISSIISSLGGDGGIIGFMNKTNKMVTDNVTKLEDVDTAEYEARQSSLERIINKIILENDFFSNDETEIIVSEYTTVYRLPVPGNSLYEFVINNSQYNIDYRSISLEPFSSYVLSILNDEIVYNKKTSDSEASKDLISAYQQLLLSKSPLQLTNFDYNSLLKEYPKLNSINPQTLGKRFYSQQLLQLLSSGKNGSYDYTLSSGAIISTENIQSPDFAEGMKQLLQGTVNGAFSQFSKNSSAFKTDKFYNIPLKDLEANQLDVENKQYSDGGLLAKDQTFKSYVNSRKNYQCLIGQGQAPDAHQVSKLRSLYGLLFNVFIVEGFLSKIFFISQDRIPLAENELIKKQVLDGIPELFDTSTTQISNLQVDYDKDIDLLYKYEVLDRKTRAKQENIEDPPPEWNLETTDEKIIFLAEKYYDEIYDRLVSRIAVSFGEDFKLQNEDLSNIYVDPPGNGSLFEMYDDVDYNSTIAGDDGGAPIPILNGLEGGLFFQKYYDIRQNGSVFEQLINASADPQQNNLYGAEIYANKFNNPSVTETDHGFGSTTEYENFQKALKNYLPQCERYDDMVFFKEGKPQQANTYYNSPYMQTNGIPCYAQAFFTKAIEQAPVNLVTAIPLGLGDVDGYENYKPDYPSKDPTGWRKDFYRTQGKISIDDYNRFYDPIFQEPFTASTPFAKGAFSASTLWQKNGPKTYYKKISTGVRMCLAIPLQDYFSNNFSEAVNILAQRYFSTLYDGPSLNGDKSLEAREIMKEKFGVYLNELGEKFFVIPIASNEKDYLEDLQDEWFAKTVLKNAFFGGNATDSEYFWHKDLQEKLNNTLFTPLKIDLRKSFESVFPAPDLAQILPLFIEDSILEEYGDEIAVMFNTTKKQIIRSIFIAKSVINQDWDVEIPAMEIDQEAMWLALVLGLVPIMVGFLATFVDPTWKTQWFLPGPLTPVGFLAKILSAT